MRRMWLVNIALLIVGCILVIIALFTPGLEKPAEIPKLTTIDSAQVQQIRIERLEKKDTIELKKQSNGHWRITAPLDLPANQFRVDNLLQILSERRYKLLDGVKSSQLAEFKLDPPLVRLSFDQLSIAYGDESPLDGGKRYIQLNQQVYLLTEHVFYHLTSDASDFASLSVLGELPKITALYLPDYQLNLVEGQWKLNSVVAQEVNTGADAINGLIDNWQHAHAMNVKTYTESPSQGEITVQLQGQDEPLRFTILATTPDLMLGLPAKGVQYQLVGNYVERLLHLPKKVVDAVATPTTVPTH